MWRSRAAVLAIVVLAFQVGRLSATSRPAPVIPAAPWGGIDEPDQGRTEAPQTSSPVPSSAGSRPGRNRPAGSGASLSGIATWFCLPGRSACTAGYSASCLCAAAGPALRAAIGPGWRGSKVTVCRRYRDDPPCVRVRLVDWCRCGHGRVVDLYAAAFSRLAPLSRGALAVTVELPGG